jgi:hypothetical protein
LGFGLHFGKTYRFNHRDSIRKSSNFAGLAPVNGAAYAFHAVKQPFINVEEKIDRFVGKRTGTPDALSTATSNKADSIAWRKALGGIRVPRGVHRFKTHEEADQWLWRMIARPKN